MSELGGKKFGSFNSYQKSLIKDLDTQHAEVLETIEKGHAPKMSNSEFNNSVQASLKTLANRKPLISKTPKTKYP